MKREKYAKSAELADEKGYIGVCVNHRCKRNNFFLTSSNKLIDLCQRIQKVRR